MQSLSLSSSTCISSPFLSLHRRVPAVLCSSRVSNFAPLSSSSFTGSPLRFSVGYEKKKTMKVKPRGLSTVCYAGPFAPRTLQWISTISSMVLMLAKGTAVQKSFLVPLFALQAPSAVISWIKGEYGIWAAFMALLVRLFFFIPGELELPLSALLLVIAAPHQVMNLRGTQEGCILAIVIAAYMAFQHFSRTGSLQNSFDQASTVGPASFLVPFFALQAPPIIISFIKGEYGNWAAFLALLIRLFLFLPEFEWTYLTFLFVRLAPDQFMNLRGTPVRHTVSIAIAASMVIEHFLRTERTRKSFDKGSVATVAIICILFCLCALS